MRHTLTSLLGRFDSFAAPIPLEELTRGLSLLSLSYDEVRERAVFSGETYRRNLIHAGPHYHALLLCWRSGQRSPIHDHTGSACGVRVLKGCATETYFERNEEGLIYASSSRSLHEGEICGSFDSDIHQISNLQTAGKELVTLHIYSPPLLQMNTYSLTDTHVRSFVEPIYGFMDGAGI